MSQDTPPDVVKWLAEIQSLQRQVAELTQERDLAYASSDNLRNLYDAEAQQRQRDALAATREIERLQKELKALQSRSAGSSELLSEPLSEPLSAEVSSRQSAVHLGGQSSLQSGVQNIRSVEQLQAQLIAAKQQCAQLQAMLKQEQTDHAQTRESLTAALGDAVDLLAKERNPERPAESFSESFINPFSAEEP
jgi:hypothetical protein